MLYRSRNVACTYYYRLETNAESRNWMSKQPV